MVDLNLAKVNKIFIFGIFLIISFWSLTYGATLKKQQYRALIFYYDQPDSLLVNELIQKIDRPLQRIEGLFHEALDVPVSVRLTKSDKEFEGFLYNQVPEWSQAVALPQQRMVILKLADAEQIKKSPQILIHELVHILLYDFLQGAYLPVWLNEGMADYFSEGGLSFEKKIVLAQAMVQKKIIDLMSIDSLLKMKAPQARLAYVEAQSAVEFMAKQFGDQRLIELLKNIRHQKNFHKAFRFTFGFDLLDFEIQWNEFIKQKYRWLVLLKFEEWIFALSGLLFLIAVVVVYLRNRKKLKTLSEEDQDDFIDGGT